MFIEIIAGLFLIIFLIKLLDPFIVPGLKRAFSFVGRGFAYIVENFGDLLYQGIKFLFLLVNLIVESIFKGIRLLFSDTIRVLGIIVLVSIVLNIIITTIAYPRITDFDTWFKIALKSFFSVYTFCFTNGVFLFGLYERMTKPRKSIFYSSKGAIHIEDLLKKVYEARRNQSKQTIHSKNHSSRQENYNKKTVYEYDEDHDEFKKSH